ncbi:MAG: DUF692 family multinuclear iron-containing protein [Bacteroidota bacterium]
MQQSKCNQQNFDLRKTSAPSLCTTYDAHDPDLLAGIMPLVEFLEITPDSIAISKNGKTKLHPMILEDLKEAASELKLLAHGVGLSIASFEGYSEAYIDLLGQLQQEVELYWHSEHLGYTTVDHENLNTMLAVPRSRDMLDLLIKRICEIQGRFGIPFLLENIVHLLPDYHPEYSDAEFLNILSQETGCGLILDLYNLECDAFNYGFDVSGFLKELNMNAVREIHLAGGVQHKGFQLDIHSGIVARSTLDLTHTVLNRENNIEVITYEILPQAVNTYGHQMVIDELGRLSDEFNIKKNGNSNIPAKYQTFA